jgi:hypothetical protein
MSGVVIVREGEDFSDALILDKTPQHDHPGFQFGLPINDRLIPSRRLFLDTSLSSAVLNELKIFWAQLFLQ